MKKALKIIGITIGILVLLVGVALLYFNFKGIPHYEVNAPDIKVEMDSAHIARGEYLATQVCAICHIGKDGNLSGQLMEDDPGFGTWYASNITQHSEAGIGKYTDGELMYLLRTGIKRSGEYAPPFMPRFNHMSDEDVKSIIAYLRSDARKVQPVAEKLPDSKPTLLAKILSNLVFKPLPYPEEEVMAPPVSDKAAYGKYLVQGALDCYGCHSASFETLDLMVPENSPGYLGGGNLLKKPGLEMEPVPSANLTMHPVNGIGKWTEEQFARAVRYGQGADGRGLSPAMPKYTLLSDEDISAIWAYLQTVPVQENNVLEAEVK